MSGQPLCFSRTCRAGAIVQECFRAYSLNPLLLLSARAPCSPGRALAFAGRLGLVGNFPAFKFLVAFPCSQASEMLRDRRAAPLAALLLLANACLLAAAAPVEVSPVNCWPEC